jgi:hypothetical protein
MTTTYEQHLALAVHDEIERLTTQRDKEYQFFKDNPRDHGTTYWTYVHQLEALKSVRESALTAVAADHAVAAFLTTNESSQP